MTELVGVRDGHRAVVDALVVRYEGSLAPEVIEQVVLGVWNEISAQASVSTYLAVLTGRVADQRLRTQLTRASNDNTVAR